VLLPLLHAAMVTPTTASAAAAVRTRARLDRKRAPMSVVFMIWFTPRVNLTPRRDGLPPADALTRRRMRTCADGALRAHCAPADTAPAPRRRTVSCSRAGG